jgi:hypothetical protein
MKQLFEKILKDYLVELDKLDKGATPQQHGDLLVLIREHLNCMNSYENLLYVQQMRKEKVYK